MEYEFILNGAHYDYMIVPDDKFVIIRFVEGKEVPFTKYKFYKGSFFTYQFEAKGFEMDNKILCMSCMKCNDDECIRENVKPDDPVVGCPAYSPDNIGNMSPGCKDKNCDTCVKSGKDNCLYVQVAVDDVNCKNFELVNKLTDADFPLKVSMIVKAMFDNNTKVSETTNKMMRAMFRVIRDETADPWAQAKLEIPGFEEYHNSVIKRNCCMTYDYVSDSIIIKPAVG